LQAEQVALFHFDCKSRVMCCPDGELGATRPYTFNTLNEAETYALRYLVANPRLGCRVYGSTGALVAEYISELARKEEDPRRQAKRDLCIGLLGFALIPLGFLFDHWAKWSMFLGMAIGTKFTIMGITKLSDGIAGLIQTRSR
jgi:hypothetical protein